MGNHSRWSDPSLAAGFLYSSRQYLTAKKGGEFMQKECSKCGKQIDEKVQICPYCRADLRDWFDKHKIWAGVIIGFVVIFGLGILGTAARYGTTDNKQDVAAGKPTPTPTDPCWQYYGTDKAQFCIQLENAQREGDALSHPLDGTVTFDNSGVYITNNEKGLWAQCTATLDELDPSADNFESDGFVIEAGATEHLGWGTFTNNESERFNYFQIKPNTLAVDCMVGGTTDPKTKAYTGGQEHRSNFNL